VDIERKREREQMQNSKIQYMQKTIGQPVPTWKVFAVDSQSDTPVLMEGFNHFEIDPNKAIRMVAGVIPRFVLDMRELVFPSPEKVTLDIAVNIDILVEDEKIRSLQDGERFILASFNAWRDTPDEELVERRVGYRLLFVQKVTAQPHYRVYIQE